MANVKIPCEHLPVRTEDGHRNSKPRLEPTSLEYEGGMLMFVVRLTGGQGDLNLCIRTC